MTTFIKMIRSNIHKNAKYVRGLISTKLNKIDLYIVCIYLVDFFHSKVSWIRHRDTHILTVGSSTYTSDHRFSTLHRQGTNEWTLQLRDPTPEDAGVYECQASTKPVRAYVVNLSVVGKSTSVSWVDQPQCSL